MHFLPILSTLRRHRTAATLIVLQIAFTCAIVCNAIFLIGERLSRMDKPSGTDENSLLRVQVAGIGQYKDAGSITEQDLASLRAIPGVKTVAVTNMVPFGGSSWNSSISTKPDDPSAPANAAMYMGSPDLLETLGTRITRGRDFAANEYVNFDDVRSNKAKMPSIIITQGLADKLFPGEDALGKAVYVWGNDPQIVVGILDHLARPNDSNGIAQTRYTMVFPVALPFTMGGNYLLSVDPDRKAEVLAAVDGALDKVDPNRLLLERQTFADIRKKYFNKDRSMAYLLAGVSIALLVITALGVVGLASFWVTQRTRQIGIRRALGATKGDILRYFQVENFILATVGIVVGMALAYGINHWLMDKYQVARLPAELLPIGAFLLWILGQIAVLGPALRASLIPPAIATRSV